MVCNPDYVDPLTSVVTVDSIGTLETENGTLAVSYADAYGAAYVPEFEKLTKGGCVRVRNSVGTVGSWNEPRVHCTKIYYPGNSRINRMVSCLELED